MIIIKAETPKKQRKSSNGRFLPTGATMPEDMQKALNGREYLLNLLIGTYWCVPILGNFDFCSNGFRDECNIGLSTTSNTSTWMVHVKGVSWVRPKGSGFGTKMVPKFNLLMGFKNCNNPSILYDKIVEAKEVAPEEIKFITYLPAMKGYYPGKGVEHKGHVLDYKWMYWAFDIQEKVSFIASCVKNRMTKKPPSILQEYNREFILKRLHDRILCE